MSRKLTSVVTGVLVLVLSTAVTTALIHSKPKPRKEEKIDDFLVVKAAEVGYKNIAAVFTGSGRVEPLESILLSAEVNGKILAGDVPLREGQSFNQGDLLLEIFSESAEAALRAARSSFLRTLSQILPDMQVDFPKSYSAWAVFFNSIDIQQPLPEMPELTQDKEKIFLASANVLSEYFSLRQQEITFEKYRIYAPFDGYFKQVSRETGSIAANGIELALIVRSDAMEIVTPIPPADAELIAAGQTVDIIRQSGGVTSGRISRIARFVDSSTQSVNVYIRHEQQMDDPLLEGEFVAVEFQADRPVMAMQIPREAIVDDSWVYLVQNQTIEKSPVAIHYLMADFAVVSGLPEGSLVITESLIDVSDGMPVQVRS